MSDLVIIQPQVTELTVTEDINQVVVSSVGVQGPAGATGATGATGAQGQSGVIAVTAPITNSGTSTSANIGVSAGSTSAAGVLQLTDSISSTSTTTAATAASVKSAYDGSMRAFSAPYVTNYVSGYYYSSYNVGYLTTSTTGANFLYANPFYVSSTTTFTRMGAEVTTLSGTTSVLRFGIYRAGTNGLPDSLVLDAGTVSLVGGVAGFREVTISQQLTPGFYYICAARQGDGNPSFRANIGVSGSTGLIGWSTPFSTSAYSGYYMSGVTGALPSSYTITAPSAATYQIQVKVS